MTDKLLLPKLNLPACEVQVRRADDGTTTQIYDPLRRKWVALTPEEWVRQNFIGYLIDTLGYSPFRISNEVGIRINGRLKRCDTIVFTDDMRALMLVEYKAPEIKLTQKTIDQVARYNIITGAPYLVVTNGMSLHCCHLTFNGDGSVATATFLKEMPDWATLSKGR